MKSVEARVAYMEGQVNEQSHPLGEMREALRHLERRMDVRFEAVDGRIDALDQKVSRQFVWLEGIHATTLIAIVGALLARS